MKYTQLNKNWSVEPNTPKQTLSQSGDGIAIDFLLDASKHEHIDEGDKGTLSFSEVYAYKVTSINEEEYKQGNYQFNNEELPWGAFYELKNSKWKNNFPEDKIIVDETLNTNRNLRHFIFFLKDEIVECVALENQFKFINTISDELDEKYPKGYFNHYLAMFASQFDKPSLENYFMFNGLYIQMQSTKEFEALKEEIKSIKANKDLPLYLKIVNYFGMENFGMKQLNSMIKEIEKFKVGRR